MQSTLKPMSLGVLLLLASVPAALRGQEVSEGAVAGTGIESIKGMPEVMRMHVQISATGKNLKEALSKLETRQAAVEKQLGELGAVKDSIVVSSPKASAGPGNQQMMEMMLRQRMMRARGKKVAKDDEAKSASASATVTAEWSLKGADATALLIAADALQEKIKSADLAKTKGSEELSPEEEEEQEEMATAMVNEDGSEGGPKPGEPAFVFVRKISDEELATATASAFAKAKKQAEQLSTAAGAKLGALRQLRQQQSSAGGDEDYSYNPYTRESAIYRYLKQQASGNSAQEAVGADASEVKLNIAIHASFSVK